MSYTQTLRRILLLLTGQEAPQPPAQVASTTADESDSKEILALKWEKVLRAQ